MRFYPPVCFHGREMPVHLTKFPDKIERVDGVSAARIALDGKPESVCDLVLAWHSHLSPIRLLYTYTVISISQFEQPEMDLNIVKSMRMLDFYAEGLDCIN